ncbi:SDR family NAD(P)-dependent oxidoreductase [Streptomyces sp. NRRL S-87]|uniref:SDR family oxidoreductase n=1 Tax=Streptomyces sp. NRRL S-87 TaxID=1463920 RepID=UPI0004BF2893|nr:SDR family NAD(P)-dependent oxidoreductase [Streptomyces sp. NRRL S-87]
MAGSRKVALVTGGSRGIGRAVVERLLEDGHDVAYCARSLPEDTRPLERLAADHGVRVHGTALDVTDAAAVAAFVEDTEERLGPLDVVVTSAGVVRDGPLATMTAEAWHEVVDTNLTGTFHVCRAAVFPLMRRQRGSIVTISSVAGVRASASQTNYSASKAGIIGFTRSLADEVARFGIRANVVAPGLIDTDVAGGLSDKARTRLLAKIPLGRAGTVREVADTVAFLASDRAGYITGQVIGVDGGVSN